MLLSCLSFWWRNFLAPHPHDRLYAIANAFPRLSLQGLHPGAISNYWTASPLPYAFCSGVRIENQTYATSTERIHSLHLHRVHEEGLPHS